MLIIRDILYCKPGKVRAMADKFVAMAKAVEKAGMGRIRIMTDLNAERYWTVVAETETPSLEAYFDMDRRMGDLAEMGEIMKGYHDLIDYGRREIYTIEE